MVPPSAAQWDADGEAVVLHRKTPGLEDRCEVQRFVKVHPRWWLRLPQCNAIVSWPRRDSAYPTSGVQQLVAAVSIAARAMSPRGSNSCGQSPANERKTRQPQPRGRHRHRVS